jgi:hypothetical protein
MKARKQKEVPTDLLVKLLDLVLTLNKFEFDMELFIQWLGNTMGTRVAPMLTNIFMGKIDKLLKECAKSTHENWMYFKKVFIVVILII